MDCRGHRQGLLPGEEMSKRKSGLRKHNRPTPCVPRHQAKHAVEKDGTKVLQTKNVLAKGEKNKSNY